MLNDIFGNAFRKFLTFVGLLVVIGGGSFLILTAASYVSPVALRSLNAAAVYLSSIFIPAPERLALTVPEKIKSGEIFNLSVSKPKENLPGTYTLNYPCVEGITLAALYGSGRQEEINCEVPFHLPKDFGDSLSLSANFTKSETITLPISLEFAEDGSGRKIGGSVNISLEGQKVETPSTPKPAPASPAPTPSGVKTPGTKSENTYTVGPFDASGKPVAATPTTSGPANLAPKLIEVGILTGADNKFTATSTLPRSEKIALRFAVENTGGKASGEWRFNAVLPTYPNHTFNSDAQLSLNGGDRIEFTFAFDRAMEGNQEIKIVIDPANSVAESGETDNELKVPLKIL